MECVNRIGDNSATAATSAATGGIAGVAKAPGALMGGYMSSDMQKNTNSMASGMGRATGGSSHQSKKLSGN